MIDSNKPSRPLSRPGGRAPGRCIAAAGAAVLLLLSACGGGGATDADVAASNVPATSASGNGTRSADGAPAPGGASAGPAGSTSDATAAGASPAAPATPPTASGTRWSDPATWGGTVPAAGAAVVIPRGKTVVLDTRTPALQGLTIQGTLVAADADVGITSDFVFVQGGRLQIGTAETPFVRSATITLTGTSTAENPGTQGFGDKVLAVMGGRLELHGRPVARNWVKLDGGDVPAGARQIRLSEPPGWRSGDQIVIATSGFDQHAYSVAEIESISGRDVMLKQGTRHRHFGAVRELGDLRVDVRAEVGLLTQNIVVQGDDASTALKIGGHAMFMSDAAGVTVQIANVQFQRMGQHDQLGRYPLHFHQIGDRCHDCYVRHSTVRDSIQRGVVVHDTSRLLLAGNVVFNTVGHNVVLETPETVGNTLDGNLALVNRQPQPLFTQSELATQNDRLPGNYWIRGAANVIANNVAAGSLSSGFIYDQPGAGDFDFRHNVVHAAMSQEGASPGDFDTTAGLMILAARPPGHKDRIEDTLVYHSHSGIWPEESDNAYVFDRFVVAENRVGVQNRGVGSKQIYRNGVFIGKLPGSDALVTPGVAMHNQYGSDNVVENPVFAGYPQGVSFAGTDTNPAQSSYRVVNARFVGARTPFALGGDMSRMTFVDDSVVPRGYYVDALAPWLAQPGCRSVTSGEDRYLHCASEPGIAELEVRLSPAATFGQRVAATVVRNDGLRYAIGSPGVASGLHSTSVLHGVPGVSYRLEAASSYYAVRLWDVGGDARVQRGDAATRVALPLDAAPRLVARTTRTQEENTAGGDPGEGGDSVPTPRATDAMRAAGSLAALDADPLGSYFYDAAARQLWVHVSSRWLVVAR